MRNIITKLQQVNLIDNGSRQDKDMISTLPPELVLEMIDDLSALDVVSLKRTNKALNAIINQHEDYIANVIVGIHLA